MGRQRAGLRKEHDLAKEIYDATGGGVIPLRAGWSGNQGVPSPDLLIPYKGSLRAVEVKTSDSKRMIIEPQDVEDVIDWSMNMTEVMTFPYISIKFNRWEIQTFRLETPWNIEKSFELLAHRSPFDVNYPTRGGNISFGHPTHYDVDVVSSRKSPGDGEAVLRDLRNDSFANVDDEKFDTVGVYEVAQMADDWYQ